MAWRALDEYRQRRALKDEKLYRAFHHYVRSALRQLFPYFFFVLLFVLVGRKAEEETAKKMMEESDERRKGVKKGEKEFRREKIDKKERSTRARKNEIATSSVARKHIRKDKTMKAE